MKTARKASELLFSNEFLQIPTARVQNKFRRIRAMKSEQIVFAYLSNLGLRPERFSKPEMRIPNQKTPDFRVFQGDTLEFYCEVKELTDTDPLENKLCANTPDILAAQVSDGESAINRLVEKIEHAVEQFRCVNQDRKHLNVLALVNTYDLAGHDNLLELLQGFLRYGDGKKEVTTRQSLRERVEQVIWEIDLYWWIDLHASAKTPEHRWLFPDAADSSTPLKLRDLFCMDGNSQPTRT